MTSCKKARALANQACKLQKPDGSHVLSRVYFGQMDGKQRQDDFADINATWSGLDCVVYTSTVEAGISFEISNHFDAVIGISNINTECMLKLLHKCFIEFAIAHIVLFLSIIVKKLAFSKNQIVISFVLNFLP